MVINVTGKLRATGELTRVRWEDGELEADFGDAELAIQRAARELDGTIVGPLPGGWSRTWQEHLDHPDAFLVVLARALESGFRCRVEGRAEVPKEPKPRRAVH